MQARRASSKTGAVKGTSTSSSGTGAASKRAPLSSAASTLNTSRAAPTAAAKKTAGAATKGVSAAEAAAQKAQLEEARDQVCGQLQTVCCQTLAGVTVSSPFAGTCLHSYLSVGDTDRVVHAAISRQQWHISTWVFQAGRQ